MATNYRLNDNARGWIKQEAFGLLDRTLALHVQGFPLHVDEVFRLMWDEEQNAAWELLRDSGVALNQYHWLHVYVKHPTVDLIVKLAITYVNNAIFPIFAGEFTPMADLNRLTDDRRQAFWDWFVPAVLWSRKISTAKRVVMEFVNFPARSGDTLAHLVSRWPDLTGVLLGMAPPWPDRVRELPKDTGRYFWPNASPEARAWFSDNINRMEATGALLTSGQMMGAVPHDASLMQGRIDSWKVTK